MPKRTRRNYNNKSTNNNTIYGPELDKSSRNNINYPNYGNPQGYKSKYINNPNNHIYNEIFENNNNRKSIHNYVQVNTNNELHVNTKKSGSNPNSKPNSEYNIIYRINKNPNRIIIEGKKKKKTKRSISISNLFKKFKRSKTSKKTKKSKSKENSPETVPNPYVYGSEIK